MGASLAAALAEMGMQKWKAGSTGCATWFCISPTCSAGCAMTFSFQVLRNHPRGASEPALLPAAVTFWYNAAVLASLQPAAVGLFVDCRGLSCFCNVGLAAAPCMLFLSEQRATAFCRVLLC